MNKLNTTLESDYKQVVASITDFYCGFLLWFLLLLFLSFFFFGFWIVFSIIYFFKKDSARSRNIYISLNNMKSSKISEFLNLSLLSKPWQWQYFIVLIKDTHFSQKLTQKKQHKWLKWNLMIFHFISTEITASHF